MLYADTSALIKYYVQEPGTEAIKKKIKEESLQRNGVFISDLGYAEICAVFTRKFREGFLHQQELDELEERFQDDWLFTLDHVELTVGVLSFVPDLLKKYALRGADAIHLASAIWLRDAARLGKSFGVNPGVLQFAAADKRLRTAASLSGLNIFDPENP